ncbi:hypothetical protein HaloA020_35230 [Halomonas sp. A020]|uniref:EF-hand domain-containing protein n=1 Tax=Halomonas sp. A020 TaxID=2717374 RepID=UPI002490D961|nr:EF-hand domain-containing protein [Halomonas sp. A020]BCB62822.1 hypothetical protein HaloA020_35230 [Halomonas sp. A020]
MANNLTLSVTLTGDGRQLTGTLRNAQGEVREFGGTTEREGGRAERSLRDFGGTAQTESTKAANALRATGGEVTTVSNHLAGMQRMATAALTTLVGFVGIRGISNEWSEIRRESELLERNLFRQQQLIETTGRSAERTAQQMLEQSRALALSTLQSTEGVMQAQQTLMTFRNIRGEVFDQAIEGALDLSAAMGTDLNSTILQVAKALEDPVTGMTALTRSGTVFTAAQRDMVREMVETNRVAEAQGFILSELAAQYGGVAQAEAQGLAGAQDTLSQAMQEARLEIGDYLSVGERLSSFYNTTANNIFRFNDALASGDLDGHIRLMTTTATIVGTAAGAYATYRSVLVAATVAQWAFNTAVRANPLGIAITLLGAATGAMLAYREELGLIDDTAQNTKRALEEYAQAIGSGNVAALNANYDTLVNALEAVSLQAQEAMAQLTELTARQRFYENSHQGISESITEAIGEQEQALASLWAEQVRIQTAQRKNREEADALQNATRQTTHEFKTLDQWLFETIKTTEQSSSANAANSESMRQQADAAAAFSARLEQLRNRLRPGRAEVVQLAQDQNTLNLAFAMGRIGVADYLQMIGALQTAYIDTQNDASDLATSTTNALYTMEGAMEELRVNGLRRLDDGFADLWLGAVDGSRSATDTIKRVWDQTLAELLHMTITRPITVQLAASMGFGGGAGGQPGGGFGISPGSVGNMWNALQGGLGGIQWGGVPTAYSSGWAGSATAGMGASGGTSFMGGSLRNFSGMQGLAGLGAGLAGSWLGGQLFGQGKHSSTLGTIGGAVGTYFGGPLGALAGSTLGSALGGIFGGSWETKDAGLNLGVSAGDITGNQFENQRKSGGWFSSSKSRTRTSALNGELEAMLQDAYAAQEASLAVTLETLGQQSSALNAFSSGLTRISTKGLDEAEVEQAVQEWLQNVVNSAAQSVTDPSQYARAGETTVDTLSRLATALNGINPILEQLHENSLAASLAGGDAASHLAELAGGIDAFSARADFYYQNVLTEAERQERAMNAAAQSMGAFTARTGRVIESTDALRELVDGIDLTTASGRELYNQAMNLAPALVEIERGLERVGQQFEQMLADASAVVADTEAQVRQAWQTFDRQSFSQQIELLNLMGDAEGALALERERELATIDEALRPTQERIWAIQDEIAVQQNATQAARNYQNEVARVRDQLNQQLGNIGNWLDQQQATSGTPEMNLATAQEQLARQLVLAENGDRTALQNITQYAQQVLDANKAYNASSAAGQRIQQDVYDAIRALPESISAEQFLADEIKTALREQTQGISTQLSDVLRGDNPSNIAGNLAGYFTTLAGGIDGVLTREQLAIVMNGKASDAQLTAILRAVDLNGDGVMSGLESVIIQSLPSDTVLGTVLRNKMNELDKNQLTSAQVRSALSPIATDDEIKRLIREIDVNGDGIISRQELGNARLSGLAGGIGATLKPMFDAIDLDTSGLIDWNEFYGAFNGLASDQELRRIFQKLDADGSGTISRLEALNRSNEGTEANTDSLEKQARDQLRELNGLVSEMARSTDQMVGFNSGIDSLTDSINALGVANAERARIERERAAAEQAERDRISKERQASSIRADAAATQSKIDEFYSLAAATGQNANGNVDRYRSYNWIDGDQGNFLSQIQGWTYQSQQAAWTARRLELADGRENELERMRQEYRSLTGELAPFANGGWTGPGGKWDPAGIVHAEEFVVRSEVVKQPGVRGMLEALNSGQAVGSTTTPRAAPLPNYPLLGNSDIVETLRDLKREVAELRRDNARLQGESNKHLAAANNQRGAAATQQIAATERGNRMLKKMEDDKRLEAAKR